MSTTNLVRVDSGSRMDRWGMVSDRPSDVETGREQKMNVAKSIGEPCLLRATPQAASDVDAKRRRKYLFFEINYRQAIGRTTQYRDDRRQIRNTRMQCFVASCMYVSLPAVQASAERRQGHRKIDNAAGHPVTAKVTVP